MPPPWTADLVADRLVAAFRRLPDHPVMSRGRAFTDDDGEEVKPFGWPERFVPDRHDRAVLMTWARCRAIGASVTKRYEDLDWNRDTAERHRRKALAAIARGLNARVKCEVVSQFEIERLDPAISQCPSRAMPNGRHGG